MHTRKQNIFFDKLNQNNSYRFKLHSCVTRIMNILVQKQKYHITINNTQIKLNHSKYKILKFVLN